MNLLPLEPLQEDEELEARDAATRARFEALRDEDPDLDQAGWRLVSRGPRKRGSGVTFTFSVRLQAREIDELRRAAEARGMNMSEFIRAAALTVARSAAGAPATPANALPDVLDATESALTQAYEHALREVRQIRESAEHAYHADEGTNETTPA